MTHAVAAGSRRNSAGRFPVVVGRWVTVTTGSIQPDSWVVPSRAERGRLTPPHFAAQWGVKPAVLG